MTQHALWQPNDWLRMTALLGAFCLFGVGVWLLISGISADGLVDLKSTVLSGMLKTASAGLFVCFFALVIITFVLASAMSNKSGADVGQHWPKTRSRRLFPIFWGCLAGLLVCGFAVVSTESAARTVFYYPLGVLGFGFAASIGAILRAIAEGD